MTSVKMSLDTVPKNLRSLRACLVCSLVKYKPVPCINFFGFFLCKTFDQFEFDGCENCDNFLRMKHNRENVYACSSSNFDGLIAVMSPEDSWVCKWQRTAGLVKGVYAISVSGKLPPGIVREMKTRGIEYRSRDVTRN